MRGGSGLGWCGAFVAFVALAGLAACSSGGGGGASPAARTAARAAASAGAVMTRSTDRVPVGQVAALVVGTRGETTVEALAVSGTTYAGEATLRITVDHESGTAAHDHVSECFRYDFRHTLHDDAPHRLDRCPAGGPIALTTTPPPPGVSAATAATVRRVLAAVPRPRPGDARTVRARLVHALGPGYQIDVQAAPKQLVVSIHSGDQCLSATVPAVGAIFVSRPADGTSCRGG